MIRLPKSDAMASWMQAVLASDRDLLAEILRRGVEALMEAERDVYVAAAAVRAEFGAPEPKERL